MKKSVFFLSLCCGALLVTATAASADTLFYDGFEGGYGAWETSGVSLAALNTYWGTYSLEVDTTDWAVRSQSTVGYSGVQVQFQHKTSGFDVLPLDYVHLEYSDNGGANWYNVNTWTTNFDWTWRNYTLPSSCADNPNFKIKLRGQTNSINDNSWWDEFYITGTRIQRTLTVTTSGSGSVSQNPAPPYYHNDVVTLTANASSGWTFDHWSGDLGGSANPSNITMDANKSVTAHFVDSTPPAAPTGLTATPGDGSVSLDWNDNTEPDLASYSVHRATTQGGPYTPLADPVSSSSHVDNTAANGTTYYYVVKAEDTANNESGYSNEAFATPQDGTAPAAPTGLSATAGSGSVSLDWNDNGEPDLAGYNVFRAETQGGPYTPVATLVSVSNYLDGTVNNGTTYYYVVTAKDSNSNESGYSNEASATPGATEFVLTVNLNGQGSVTQNPLPPYAPQTVVTLTAVPAEGWSFVEWSGDLTGSTNPSNITMNANKTVTATFSQGQYTLATSVAGFGHIDNTNPKAYYAPNETTTLRAIPDSGYEFTEWTGTVASTSNPIDLTFTQNHNVTAHFQASTPPGPVLGTRVLLVGDSWTQAMWNDQTLGDVFADNGFAGVYEKGDVTAISGTTASWWALPGSLQLITNELTTNPDIDMVHLSMGGNDVLAGQSNGGWYKGMGEPAEEALWDTIQDNVETVVQHILGVRPTIHIVIASYDYINFWDTLNVPANQLMWNNLGQPTPRELNDALIQEGDHMHELAIAYGERLTYVNNWGLMHREYGYNEVFPAYRFGCPWGHPNYPWPKSCGANNGDDPIHLNTAGYYKLGQNCWTVFYRYLIDPNAGELPPDADDFPAPPPAYYTSFFYDGFENTAWSSANWVMSSTSYMLGNTYWGVVSLELDRTDSAIRWQNTTGYQNIRVRFDLKISGFDLAPADYFYVEYTANGGGNWTTLKSWTSNFDWSFREYLLPAAAENNPAFGLRFRSYNNSKDDNAWIDEVSIEGTPVPCTLRSLVTRMDGVGSVAAAPNPDYGTSYCDGTQVTLTATPGEGWSFVGWYGSASGTTNPLTIAMDANKTIVAQFVDSAGEPGLSPDQYDWTKLVSWGLDVDALGLTWPDATASQASSLLYKANEAQTIFETYHMPYGQAANMWYVDQTRNQVAKYETIGDSAAFLGYYLGGLCAKYHVTGDSATLTQINSVLDTIDWLSVCSGKSGYLVRFAGLASDPAYQAYYQGYGNGSGTCVAPWQDYVWLDYSSRDTYIGVAAGLGNVWIHVSDPATRAKCQTITERVLDRLIADGFNIISPTGKFTNFTFGFNALWQRLGISMNDPKYGSQYGYGSTFWWWEATGGMDIKDMFFADYFANVLNTSELYVVRRLETNQDKIDILNAKLLSAAETDGGSHLNAHFSACYAGGTGNAARNIPRGILQGGLIDYASGENWMKAVDQTGNPAYPPADAEHSVYALLVRDRPQNEYLWQREANRYAGGVDGIAWEYMMLDKFVPYWMGREAGAIPAP